MRWARLIMIFALLTAGPAVADAMRLAVTTSFQNSGLSGILLPQIASDTGVDVLLIVVGTGQAIRLGEAGDVDAILVHSREAEDAFVATGFGTHRREIMFNDFVIIGPAADPAGVGGAKSAADAFRAIAFGNVVFTSRGDDSGTHRRELSLWTAAGINPDGPLYRELGAGMGATLNTAVAMGAYVLSDRASWLNFGNKGDMEIAYQGDPVLFNQYAYIPVSLEMHAHVNFELAKSVEAWLVSEKGQRAIGAYTINGQTLFTPNATDN